MRQAGEGPISGQDLSRARVRYAIVREPLSTLLRNRLFVKMCPVTSDVHQPFRTVALCTTKFPTAEGARVLQEPWQR